MDDLVQWLRAQLDEEERIARAACEYASREWHLDEEFGETVLWWPPEPHIAEKEREKGFPVVSDRWRGETVGTRIAPHIARHDPARVLREINAKRQILRLHSCPEGHECSTLDRHGEIDHCTWVMDSDACTTLRLLALPYEGRPGYRAEWRP